MLSQLFICINGSLRCASVPSLLYISVAFGVLFLCHFAIDPESIPILVFARFYSAPNGQSLDVYTLASCSYLGL